MNTKEASAHFAVLLGICLILAAVVGWVMNVVAIANTSAFSGMVVLRAIGVFILPIGAVMGYL